ncbi:MAG: hypothetical protein K8R92_10995 [Planctomycetes bacterium]|nr:hypothetical protein [Planctomycetota bacterium]
MKPILALCTVWTIVGASSALGDAPTFLELDLGVPGYFDPTGISSDGRSIVGGSYIVSLGNKARRWREGIGFDYPGPGVNPNIASWCSGISADGSVISGGNGHAVFGDLEGWMRYGGSAGHVGSPQGQNTSDCLAVSSSGVVTVGYGGKQSNPNLFQAARYTEAGDWINMGFLPGGDNSKATAVSALGTVIAGWSTDAGHDAARAWRWTTGTGMVSIGNLPAGAYAQPTCMSADGSVIYGHDNDVAWRWTASTGITELPLNVAASASYPYGCSADGSVVVGLMQVQGTNIAFIWDEAHGMLDLRELLIAQGLTELSSWSFESAGCIAGSNPWMIAGLGGEPGGFYRAFRVSVSTLDAPAICSCDLDGDGSVDGADLGLLLLDFGDCGDPMHCPADLDGDGAVDGADLGLMLLEFGDCPS